MGAPTWGNSACFNAYFPAQASCSETKDIMYAVGALLCDKLGSLTVTANIDGSDIHVDLTSTNTLIGAGNTILEDIDGDLETLHADLLQIETNQGTINTSITGTNTKLDTLHADNGTIEGKLDTLHADNGTIEGKLDTIDADLGTINTSIASTNAKLDTLHTDNGTIEGKLDTIDGDLDTLHADLLQIETNQGTINTSITSTNTKLDSLHTDLGTLHTDNVAIEGKLDAVNTNLGSIITTEGNILTAIQALQTQQPGKLIVVFNGNASTIGPAYTYTAGDSAALYNNQSYIQIILSNVTNTRIISATVEGSMDNVNWLTAGTATKTSTGGAAEFAAPNNFTIQGYAYVRFGYKIDNPAVAGTVKINAVLKTP